MPCAQRRPQPKDHPMTTMSNDANAVLARYVPGFKSNLNLSPQQKKSHLIDAVDSDLSYAEPGEMFNLDDLGESEPEDVAVRVADTPDKFLGGRRRVGVFTEFHDSAWLDNVDKAKLLEDPTNMTMAALMAGRWRKADTKIMEVGLGTALEKNAATGALDAVSLPASQIIPADYAVYKHDAETIPGSGDYGMSVGKIIGAGALLDESEVEGDRFIALSSDDVASLLTRTPVTSQYFAAVQALTEGKIEEFLGFRIKKLSKKRFLTVSTNRRVMAWVKPAIAYRGRPITNARIAIRNDKSDTPQAFYKTSHAGGRRYDEGVVEIRVKI